MDCFHQFQFTYRLADKLTDLFPVGDHIVRAPSGLNGIPNLKVFTDNHFVHREMDIFNQLMKKECIGVERYSAAIHTGDFEHIVDNAEQLL